LLIILLLPASLSSCSRSDSLSLEEDEVEEEEEDEEEIFSINFGLRALFAGGCCLSMDLSFLLFLVFGRSLLVLRFFMACVTAALLGSSYILLKSTPKIKNKKQHYH